MLYIVGSILHMASDTQKYFVLKLQVVIILLEIIKFYFYILTFINYRNMGKELKVNQQFLLMMDGFDTYVI